MCTSSSSSSSSSSSASSPDLGASSASGSDADADADALPEVFSPLQHSKHTSLFVSLDERTDAAKAGGGRGVGTGREGDGPRIDKINSVRAELLRADPGLNQSLISSGTTISQLFTQDKWENHRSVRRYWTALRDIAGSTVFRRVTPPCLLAAFWAACCCALGLAAPATPLTLTGHAIALLLVFRTNQAYARFHEGRALWGQLVASSRDVARLTGAFASVSSQATRDEAAGLLRLVDAYAWVMKGHLRSGRTREDPNDPSAYRDDPAPFVRTVLAPDEADSVLLATNKPLHVTLLMTDCVRNMGGNVPVETRQTLLDAVKELARICGGCERLLSTPIPLSYTRHTGRALMIWLLCVPAALQAHMGWLTVPVVFVMSYLLIGIDEIGVQIEEPFAILPLRPLCDTIRRDVRLVAEHYGLRDRLL